TRWMRAAPAVCVFAAAAATGSRESALLVLPPPQPAVRSAAAAIATAAAIPTLRRWSMSHSVVRPGDAEGVISPCREGWGRPRWPWQPPPARSGPAVRRTGRPALLSVLPVLLAAAAFGSRASLG